MTLKPSEIREHTFSDSRRGYDRGEVDAYLRSLADGVAELIAQRDGASQRLEAVERDAAEAIESERLLKRALVTAERSAEDTVNEARAEAERLRQETQAACDDLLERARTESQELRDRADRDTTHAREQATHAVDQIHRAVEDLRRFREEYRERVQGAIAEQIAVLDRMGELPDLAPEIQRLSALRAPGGDGPADEVDAVAQSQPVGHHASE